MHTDRYLHFRSHHPPHLKRGMVRCLYDHARCIVQQGQNLKKEENHLPWGMVILVPSSNLPLLPSLRGSTMGKGRRIDPPTVHLPYMAGVSESIKRVCKDFNIRAVFRSRLTLCSLLTKVKDPLPMEKQGNIVYEVQCTCGKVYISGTRRQLETSLKEHKDACIKASWTKICHSLTRLDGGPSHLLG